MFRLGVLTGCALLLIACRSERAQPTPDVPTPPPAEERAAVVAVVEGPIAVVPVPVATAQKVKLVQVLEGLRRPVGWEFAPDQSGRVFVVEQRGTIRIARRTAEGGFVVSNKPALKLRGKLSTGREQGLLGLAFHPQFAENRRLFINYTDRKGNTQIDEYRVQGDIIERSSRRNLFSLEQPYRNHNGGYLEFGPDGMLYVGTGDGGSAGDPRNAGQNDEVLLAKLLRIDVDAPTPVPEIVAKGLRNPWRFHFDTTGDLYIADVGQDKWEWVHVTPAAELKGKNYGWNITEGSHCFQQDDCDKSGLQTPVVEYSHEEGCSITGGVVYRGKAIPAVEGIYFYSDFCTALLRGFRWSKDGARDHWDWKTALDPEGMLSQVSAFGTDEAGEVYILSLEGRIFQLVPAG